MSVWYDYRLQVLTAKGELDRIAIRLAHPSAELVRWAALRSDKQPSEIADNIAEFVRFERDAARPWIFRISFKNWSGLVNSHLYEVSTEFPHAAFLLSIYGETWSSNQVILGGKLVAESDDSNDHAQGIDWALVDIFPAFHAEHQADLPFGTLWHQWLDDMADAVERLKAADERWWLSIQANRCRPPTDNNQLCPDAIDLTFDESLPDRCPIPAAPKHHIRRELRDGVFRTLCNVCKKPIPAVTLDGSAWSDPEVPAGPATCFEVVPCNVRLFQPDGEDKPRTHVERWRRMPERVVICAECWARVGVGTQ